MWFPKPLRRLAGLAIAVCLFAFWACHMGNEEGKAYLNVKADTTWFHFDSVWVVLQDSAGTPLDTIFHGKLTSLDQLTHLPAEGYQGGKLKIVLLGFQGGVVAIAETRQYDGQTQTTVKKDTVDHPINPDTGKSIDLQPDVLTLYTGGPHWTLTATPFPNDLVWSSSDTGIAKVSNGEVIPVKAGIAYIKATSGLLHPDSTMVTVVTDPPVIAAGADTAVMLNDTVAFQVKVTQAYGIIESFKWSLDGDSAWDDSASNFPVDKQYFSAPAKKFSAAGQIRLLFYARDGEGNAVTASRTVVVSTQVPKITSLTKDTTVTAGDSLAFAAKAVVNAGTLKKYLWDYDGNGVAEDSGSLSASTATIAGGHRYAKAGSFTANLRVVDNVGTAVSGVVIVTVKPNTVPLPPDADAGKDTSMLMGTLVNLHGKGSDPDGQIAKREWKIGTGSFTAVSKGDTAFTAPTQAGTVPCIFKVTDNDGLIGQDTVIITVTKSPPPTVTSLTPGDTTITIKDSLAFVAKVTSKSTLASYSWDFNGDGTPDDSGTASGTSATLSGGHRFASPGVFDVLLNVQDQAGDMATRQVRVTVKLDPPTASAGKDTSVPQSGKVNLHGTGADSLGKIVKLEWKIGAGAYTAVSKGDTSFTAPAAAGKVTCLFRVTDDDGLTDDDTVIVTVLPSANANLSALAITPGTLAPVFAPATIAYAVSLTTGSFVSITPTAADAKATLALNGKAAISGKAVDSLAIAWGANVFKIDLTAEDGVTKKSYTLTVNKIDTIPPTAPKVTGPSLSISPNPTWTWTSGGGGNGSFRYKLDDATLGNPTATTGLTFSGTSLSTGTHTLYVQERDDAGNWSTSGSFAITVDPGAPISRYPFDGNGNDIGLNHNNGILTGTTPTADHLGNATGALFFNGVSDVIHTGTAATATGTTVTVSMWVKIPAATTLQYFVYSPSIGIWSRNGAVGMAISTPTTSSASAPVTLGAWTHFTGSYDGNTIRIYINGVASGATIFPGSIAGTLSDLTIGLFGSTYWTGSLDDVRFYNRVLTPAEIKAIFQGTM